MRHQRFDVKLSLRHVPLRPGQIGLVHGLWHIQRDDVVLHFGPKKFQMLAAMITRAPERLSSGEILDHVYVDDPDGGSLGYRITNTLRRSLLNPRLAMIGLCIPTTGTYHRGDCYEIVELPEYSARLDNRRAADARLLSPLSLA